MDVICGIAMFLIAGLSLFVDGRDRLKRGRGGKTTKQGRTEMVLAILFLLLAIISFLIFAFEQITIWINSLTHSLNLPEGAELLICYGLIIFGVLGTVTIISFLIKDDIRNFVQKYRTQSTPNINRPVKEPSNQKKQKTKLPKLVPLLDDIFDEEEFKMFCFELGIDYDNLRGQGKRNKARELVKYLERRNRIPELMDLIREKRPNIIWRQYI